jgi:transposase-like protein
MELGCENHACAAAWKRPPHSDGLGTAAWFNRAVEIGMLVVETVVRIRREYAAGKPIKAICRDLRPSRKVVRKAIRAEEGAFSYRRATQPFPKIGPVRDRLCLSFKRHRFPPEIIRHAIWLYFRFSLSLRDVEELLACM